MALYTRKQYETDCAMIDRKIALSADLLADRDIGPLQHWTYARAMDECKRRLGMKLAMTAMQLADKKKTEGSRHFAWVIGATKEHESGCARLRKPPQFYCSCKSSWFRTSKREPRLKHTVLTNGHWRDSSIFEIQGLEDQGVTVVESGFGKKHNDPNAVEAGAEYDQLVWEELTREQAIARQAEGEFHEFKGERVWKAKYMLRTEGEGEQQKYYSTEV